ncbi:MAG: leucine-rich repeat domain-containing protein, partial [Clostridia bacterium]|nr:leucine-rich repeat domain-containing protein [Clostridia bacterium]
CDGLTSIIVDEDNPNYKTIDGNLYSKDGKTLLKYAEGTSNTIFEIPAGVTTMGSFAFADCNRLTSVIIPDSVTIIYDYTFDNCDGLTSIIIPDSVTIIREFAFRYCDNLTSVTIGSGVTTIVDNAFYQCFGLTSIIVDEDNPKYKSIDGNLYSKDGRELIQYAIGKLNTTFEIPAGVEIVGYDAFAFCDNLTSIIIPDSVTTISMYAFAHCDSLTSIIVDEDNPNYKSIDGNLYSKDGKTLIQYAIGKSDATFDIPAGVTTIGEDAFSNCDSLTSIIIPESVTSVGEFAFRYCDSLTSIIIPESVTTIGKNAFSGCTSLTSVTIGSGVTTIGKQAFYSCNSLTDVYFTGTEEEWNQIVIGWDNGCLTNATIHYNYVPEE